MKSKPDLTTAAAVEKRFTEISNFVDSSIDEIESNAEVDLMGIEYAVDHVCEAFSKLPETDQDKLDKHLGNMVKSLENLAAILKSHPDLVEGSETDFPTYDGDDDEDWDEEEDE